MKKLLFIVLVLVLNSCEEVVKVDLDTAAPRLVVDASIDWEKGTTGNQQLVKLSTTTGFYSNVIPSVSGAVVFVTNSSGTIFNFIEEVPNTGEYICNNFVPVIGENYVLTVNYAGQTYIASEKMIAVPEITNITQRDDAGFNGNDIEVKFNFQDNGLEDNSYMSRFVTTINAFPELQVFDDRFQQGNQLFGLYSNSDLNPGDTIDYTLFGISTQYYNYMNILLSIAGTNGGSPFQTPPATVRGNMVNQNNEDNYCLGYFRLCEVVKTQYLVQ
ncbi:MAG: DUF4249 family protein [Flavobacterium sp.]|uniref:DUF4249 family protein n=1 Tax=Flavobacterium sp. TaxID=239 RepID=UPI00326448EE